MGLLASFFLASSSFCLMRKSGSSLTFMARSVVLLAPLLPPPTNRAPGPDARACMQKSGQVETICVRESQEEAVIRQNKKTDKQKIKERYCLGKYV